MAIVLLWAVSLPAAYAHLMVAQRGTLNLVDNGAFMVISLPVTALAGTDDDGDSRLPMSFRRTESKLLPLYKNIFNSKIVTVHCL
jgi:hypothetical protein